MRIEKVRNSPYQDLYRMYEFNPQGKEFDFNFEKGTCYKLASGVCALEAFFKDLDCPDYYEYCSRDHFDRCVRAYLSLKNNITIGNLPILHLHKCGHYGFTDGRHRICVALKKNMLIDIEFHKSIIDDVCEKCLPVNTPDKLFDIEHIQIPVVKESVHEKINRIREMKQRETECKPKMDADGDPVLSRDFPKRSKHNDHEH